MEPAEDPLSDARQRRDAALACAASGLPDRAEALFAELAERHGGDDEALRWLVADAVVQRADLARRRGDVTAALSLRHHADAAFGELIRLDGYAMTHELDAATELAEAGEHMEPLDRFRRVTCGYDGDDAPAEAVTAHRLAARQTVELGWPVEVTLFLVDAWLRDAGADVDADRRIEFGWLRAQRAWANVVAERHREAVADVDRALAGLDEPPGDEELVEWLREQRAASVEQLGWDAYERGYELFVGDGPIGPCESALREAADNGVAAAWLLLGYLLEARPGALDGAREAYALATESDQADVAGPAHLRLARILDHDLHDRVAAAEHGDHARRVGEGDVRERAAIHRALLAAEARDWHTAEEALFAFVGSRLDLGDAVGDTRSASRLTGVFVGLLRRPRIRRHLRRRHASGHRRRRRRDRRDARRRG